MNVHCPVCSKGALADPFADIEGFAYYACRECDTLFVDPAVLEAMDTGESPRDYDQTYWQVEDHSARQRAQSDALVRAGQAILYARREVRRFLDVGAGPGYLLDQLSSHFPARQDLFHAVELFPPEVHSAHPNYRVGKTSDLEDKFDAGVCVEVVEHLTPKMLSELLEGLSKVSQKNALWLFNTGLSDYVRNEDPGYLDPRRRGHIISYGLRGATELFARHGFRVSALPGMSFAFIAEFEPDFALDDFSQRFYGPLPANKLLLEEAGLIYQAAFDSGRAYYYRAQSHDRALWATRLDRELSQCMAMVRKVGERSPGMVKKLLSRVF